MKKIKSRIGKRLAIIVFFVFTVFLYGPYSIFLPNSEDLWFTLPILTNIVLPVSAIAFAVLFILCIAIPDEKHHIFTKILFGLSLALYVQGNYINISYAAGVQDGTEIIWSNYTWYAILDTLAWILCFAVPFIIDLIVKKNNKTFRKTIVIASLFLTVIQIPAFASQALNYTPSKNTDLKITTDNMFELSESENTLVFLLDAMDGEYWNEFIESHPEYTENLTGFVCYDNAIAAGGRTVISIPAMFTGTPFTRQETYSEYLEKVWSKDNVFSALDDAGYEVSVYSSPRTFSTEAIDYIDNFETGGGKVGSMSLLGEKIFKMDFYKFLPHLLKPYFWYTTSELSEAQEIGSSYVSDDFTFYDSFLENGFTVDSSKNKVFQYYHLNGAHTPYTMDEYGNKSKKTTAAQQVAGTFYRISQILDDLKAKGLYDSATILISADHGETSAAAKHVTFLLKEAGATGAYSTNSAPVSGYDIIPYLTSVAGNKLSVPYAMDLAELTEETDRERHYFHSTNANSQLLIKEYVTNQHVSENMTVVKTYDDSWARTIPAELGEELTFRTDATANRYTIDGFGQNTGYRTLLRGPYAKMEIPLAELPEDGVSVYIKPFHKLPPVVTTMKVVANGEPVFEGKINKSLISKGITFPLSADSFGSDKLLTLEFYFPEIDDSEMAKKVTKRTESISLVTIRIDAQETTPES